MDRPPHLPGAKSPPSNGGADYPAPRDLPRIDWPGWLRSIERKRRLVLRKRLPRAMSGAPRVPIELLAASTIASFRLDGMDITDMEIAGALSRLGPVGAGAALDVSPLAPKPAGTRRPVLRRPGLRTRQGQRLRNHISILLQIEKSLRRGEPFKTPAVIRWYTSISSGLSTAALSDGAINRIDAALRHINSPQFRLQPALIEAARMHVQLLVDPVVPGFNGILARLLLRCHLGRGGFPPVVFDPLSDASVLKSESRLLPMILEMLSASYDLLLAKDPSTKPWRQILPPPGSGHFPRH